MKATAKQYLTHKQTSNSPNKRCVLICDIDDTLTRKKGLNGNQQRRGIFYAVENGEVRYPDFKDKWPSEEQLKKLSPDERKKILPKEDIEVYEYYKSIVDKEQLSPEELRIYQGKIESRMTPDFGKLLVQLQQTLTQSAVPRGILLFSNQSKENAQHVYEIAKRQFLSLKNNITQEEDSEWFDSHVHFSGSNPSDSAEKQEMLSQSDLSNEKEQPRTVKPFYIRYDAKGKLTKDPLIPACLKDKKDSQFINLLLEKHFNISSDEVKRNTRVIVVGDDDADQNLEKNLKNKGYNSTFIHVMPYQSDQEGTEGAFEPSFTMPDGTILASINMDKIINLLNINRG